MLEAWIWNNFKVPSNFFLCTSAALAQQSPAFGKSSFILCIVGERKVLPRQRGRFFLIDGAVARGVRSLLCL